MAAARLGWPPTDEAGRNPFGLGRHHLYLGRPQSRSCHCCGQRRRWGKMGKASWQGILLMQQRRSFKKSARQEGLSNPPRYSNLEVLLKNTERPQPTMAPVGSIQVPYRTPSQARAQSPESPATANTVLIDPMGVLPLLQLILMLFIPLLELVTERLYHRWFVGRACTCPVALRRGLLPRRLLMVLIGVPASHRCMRLGRPRAQLCGVNDLCLTAGTRRDAASWPVSAFSVVPVKSANPKLPNAAARRLQTRERQESWGSTPTLCVDNAEERAE